MLVSCNCGLVAKATLQGKRWSKFCLEKNAAFSEQDVTGTILRSTSLSVRQVCVAKLLDFFDVAIRYITLSFTMELISST